MTQWLAFKDINGLPVCNYQLEYSVKLSYPAKQLKIFLFLNPWQFSGPMTFYPRPVTIYPQQLDDPDPVS